MRISKTKFMAGAQCLKPPVPASHQPELSAEPDPAAEMIIEQGYEVGLLARQLFPGGIEVNVLGGLEAAIRSTPELSRQPCSPCDI